MVATNIFLSVASEVATEINQYIFLVAIWVETKISLVPSVVVTETFSPASGVGTEINVYIFLVAIGAKTRIISSYK
jgi:hypothetical protein